MRWSCCGDKDHAIKLQEVTRGLTEREVPVMDRIKRPAEYTDLAH
jgi:hypothetical protein